ncbi:MAG TPA: gliding motility-associated C-terminal domain-containing protein [Bacteroidales bacterium]
MEKLHEKHKNWKLIKVLLWLLLLLCSAKSLAQVTATSGLFTSKKENGEDIEYVSIGSIMPYKVSPFNWGTLASFMNPSIFKWWLNGNTTGYELLKSDGITPLTLLPPPNHVYYPDSSISIHWIKTGKYTIRVHEKSMPKNITNSCDPGEDIQTLDVVVADRPSVAWNGPTSENICNLTNNTHEIPVLLKGSKQITVTYQIIYTPQTGLQPIISNQTVVFDIKKNDTTATDNVQINVPSKNYGTYEVIITGITDKVATKCGIPSQKSDYPSDIYTLTVSNSNLNLAKDISICEGEAYKLNVNIAYQSIQWSTGSTDSSILISQPGYYKAKVILPNGCKAEDSTYLSVYPKPVFSLGKDTMVCEGQSIILDPKVEVSSYVWSTGETTPTISVNAKSGLVWARLTDIHGCSFIDSVLVIPCNENVIKKLIPNAFTPNNDNDNDTWRIDILTNYPNASVAIYNRWGQLVYKAEKNYPPQGWDGASNGRPLPMDTYFYVIDLKDGSKPLMGSLNLIR